MGKDRRPRQIMLARPEGKRTRGKPRKAYMNGIEEIARKNGMRVTELGKKWIEAVPTL